jgi:CubicO group peptidase (beta-lactamase class C family)
LDFLKNTDKEKITIRQLLFHTSGLQPSISCYPLALEKKGTKHPLAVDIYSSKWQYKKGITSTSPSDSFSIQVADDFYLHNKFHAMAMNKLVQTKLGAKTYVYSCINFILLKEIIESISGLPMNEFLDKEFYEPMGLEYTSYLPLQKFEKENIAPTLRWDFLRTEKIQGYVHDPDAAFLGGVSGNAGLFSTARDIALIHQMLLNKGKLNGKRYLSDETCSIFTTSVSPSGRRGLGFDKPVPDEPKINPCCPSAPNTTYGHTGYTGTGAWVDPDNQIVYVFLSNRTYPNDGENKLAKMDIRPKIQEMIYKSLGISKNN